MIAAADGNKQSVGVAGDVPAIGDHRCSWGVGARKAAADNVRNLS